MPIYYFEFLNTSCYFKYKDRTLKMAFLLKLSFEKFNYVLIHCVQPNVNYFQSAWLANHYKQAIQQYMVGCSGNPTKMRITKYSNDHTAKNLIVSSNSRLKPFRNATELRLCFHSFLFHGILSYTNFFLVRGIRSKDVRFTFLRNLPAIL